MARGQEDCQGCPNEPATDRTGEICKKKDLKDDCFEDEKATCTLSYCHRQSTGTGCPGRLWSLHLWRYSRPAWTRSSTTYCR